MNSLQEASRTNPLQDLLFKTLRRPALSLFLYPSDNTCLPTVSVNKHHMQRRVAACISCAAFCVALKRSRAELYAESMLYISVSFTRAPHVIKHLFYYTVLPAVLPIVQTLI